MALTTLASNTDANGNVFSLVSDGQQLILQEKDSVGNLVKSMTVTLDGIKMDSDILEPINLPSVVKIGGNDQVSDGAMWVGGASGNTIRLTIEGDGTVSIKPFTNFDDNTQLQLPAFDLRGFQELDVNDLVAQNLYANGNQVPIVDAGIVSTFSVPPGGTKDVIVTFDKSFPSSPAFTYNFAASDVGPLYTTDSGITAVSATQATVHIVNKGAATAYYIMHWQAVEIITKPIGG